MEIIMRTAISGENCRIIYSALQEWGFRI